MQRTFSLWMKLTDSKSFRTLSTGVWPVRWPRSAWVYLIASTDAFWCTAVNQARQISLTNIVEISAITSYQMTLHSTRSILSASAISTLVCAGVWETRRTAWCSSVQRDCPFTHGQSRSLDPPQTTCAENSAVTLSSGLLRRTDPDWWLRPPLVREPCTRLYLTGLVDDATSRLMQLRFVKSESTFTYSCHFKMMAWRSLRGPYAWCHLILIEASQAPKAGYR